MMNNLILNSKIKRRPKFVRTLLLVISTILIVVFLLFPIQVKNLFSLLFNNFFSAGVSLGEITENHKLITTKKSTLFQENIRLRKENELLRQKIIFKPNEISSDTINASIVARPPFTKNNLIIIDKGYKNNVRVGDIAFTDNIFIVGVVSKVTSETSEILTFVSNASTQKIVVGDYIGDGIGRNTDILINVPETEDISIGDNAEVVIRDKRYVVGKVNYIEKQENELIKMIFIQPIINTSKLSNINIFPK